jgi:hypothetical protein
VSNTVSSVQKLSSLKRGQGSLFLSSTPRVYPNTILVFLEILKKTIRIKFFKKAKRKERTIFEEQGKKKQRKMEERKKEK